MSELLLMTLGGVFAGLFGSILGLGGGVLIIPMLTLLFGIPMREAVGVSLVCVIATSSGAASLYVKKGLSDVRLGMTLELATTVGAIVGGVVAGLLNQRVLLILFAVLLMYTAWSMSRKAETSADQENTNHEQGAGAYTHLPLGMGGSFFAGNVSGLLGVGGGIIKVPAMYLFMRVPLKTALATSNFMIGVTASAGAFVYFSRGEVHPLVAGSTMLGVFLGATGGSRLLPKIRTILLKRIFVLVLAYLSIEMLFKGLRIALLF
jgi:uncharacterized membrane protein YfcA